MNILDPPVDASLGQHGAVLMSFITLLAAAIVIERVDLDGLMGLTVARKVGAQDRNSCGGTWGLAHYNVTLHGNGTCEIILVSVSMSPTAHPSHLP